MPFEDVLSTLELLAKGILPDDMASVAMPKGRTPFQFASFALDLVSYMKSVHSATPYKSVRGCW